MRYYATAVSALAVLLLSGAATAQPEPPEPPGPDDPPTDGVVAEEPDDPGDPLVGEGEPGEGDPGDSDAGQPDAVPPPPAEPVAAEVMMAPPLEQSSVVEGLPPVPLAPPAIFPVDEQDELSSPTAGFRGGYFFLRDPDDDFRLYPGGRLRTDFNWAAGAPDLEQTQDGGALNPSFHVRRVRLELSGEIMQRLAFTMGVEMGGGRIGETEYVGPATSRFARASAHDGMVRPAEVSVSYRFRDWLNFTVGQHNLPFSMSNRTREHSTPFLERNVAIRGFAVPHDKDLGLTVWGELFGKRTLAYELGVFSGDGPDHPGVDSRPDFAGRIFARPLTSLGDDTFFQLAQVGLSARHGERDQEAVAYDYPTIASGQGFVFWQPGYVDSLDRVTHVIPSGSQNAIGGELRLPFRMPTGAVIELRGEAYYLANNTREAVEGYLATNTERFGRVNGVGWYAMLTWWACCTDQLVSDEPGIYRPVHVDLDHEAPNKKGLEVSALVASIVANYNGATREGSTADPNTPDKNIALYQFGGIAQYWFNHNFRASLEYMAYLVPDSGDPERNQALVPDNLHRGDDGQLGSGTVHHELGSRFAVTF